jgi:hypothetical protein
VIRQRIPGIAAMINKTIDDIEVELNQIGRPLANDAGVSGSFYSANGVCFFSYEYREVFSYRY